MSNMCVMCGEPSTRTATEKVTGQDLLVPCHPGCEQKARVNSLYGQMVELMDVVREHIEDNEPADQNRIEELWGRAGLYCVRRLFDRGEVSYDIDFDLVMET